MAPEKPPCWAMCSRFCFPYMTPKQAVHEAVKVKPKRLQDIGEVRNVRSFWREAAGVDRKGAIVNTGNRLGRAELP